MRGASAEDAKMRNWILCAFLTLGLPGCAPAQQHSGATQSAGGSQSTSAPSKLAELLESKVRAAWAAFKKRDKDAYAAFLTDDFQGVEADGDGERPKIHILREVEHSVYTDYLLQLFQVQQLGSDYAFVTYESTIQFPKTAGVRFKRIFIGELWTKRDGEWKMMRYQETPVR
jgi:uncharacterized protein (TIGR02246 family)